MSETLQYIVAVSLEIAWDYLEATGELGNPDRAAEHLLDTIEVMIRHGERRDRFFSPTGRLAPTSVSERSRSCPLRPVFKERVEHWAINRQWIGSIFISSARASFCS
jgi:hypothetical protein